MDKFEGQERRRQGMQMNQDDRDRFIKMEEGINHLIDLTRHHRQDFKTHIEEDNSKFSVIFRFLWGFAGAGTLLAVATMILKLSNFIHI